MNIERSSEDRALEIISLVREKFSIESPQVSINKEYSLNFIKKENVRVVEKKGLKIFLNLLLGFNQSSPIHHVQSIKIVTT